MTLSNAADGLAAISHGLADAVETASSALVVVHGRHRLPSTGIVWRPGVIVTADHTIELDDNVVIVDASGARSAATLAGRDSGTDLAVLRVPDSTLTPVQTVEGAEIRVGHLAMAVGRSDDGVSASFGAISALGDAWTTHRAGMIDRFVRADVTLYPGFSGGPLIDVQGRVIGLNTSGLARGMSLTVPVSTVHRVVEELLTRGHIARGYLGLGFQPVSLPEMLVASLTLPEKVGLVVVTVEPEGPADTGGAMIGDILVALDGQPMTGMDRVQESLNLQRVGTAVPATIVRGGQLTTLQIVIGERPYGGDK